MGEPERHGEDGAPPPAPADVGSGQATGRLSVVAPKADEGLAGSGELHQALVTASILKSSEAAAIGVVAFLYSQLMEAQSANRRLQSRIDQLQEDRVRLEREKGELAGKQSVQEKPWLEHSLLIAGGGLMGFSFKIWESSAGGAIFLFVVGAILTTLPWAPDLLKAIGLWKRS